jgi:hypothetical protein
MIRYTLGDPNLKFPSYIDLLPSSSDHPQYILGVDSSSRLSTFVGTTFLGLLYALTLTFQHQLALEAPMAPSMVSIDFPVGVEVSRIMFGMRNATPFFSSWPKISSS